MERFLKYTLPLEKINFFPKLFLAYVNKSPDLITFYSHFASIENFQNLINDRKFPKDKRKSLVEGLKKQYESFSIHPHVEKNIHLLEDEKTFTITTGHQLVTCTGPLYFIYKISTVINSCIELKRKYPHYNFVPVFWLAGEDHDVEEINHFHLFGKKWEWQPKEKGPVGRMSTKPIQELLHNIPEVPEIFTRAYTNFETIAGATKFLVNELFGEHGVICIDGDDRQFKKNIIPYIKDELNHQISFREVSDSIQKLEKLGYKPQASPRQINLFFVRNQLRERIVFENGTFKILNTDLQFSSSEILKLLEEEPECFSPNVLLRPLYQESILPNLAYCGGPAEITYWLQLKSLFDYFKIPFPILLPRNFCLTINKSNYTKVKKLNLTFEQLFAEENELKNNWLHQNGLQNFTLSPEMKQLEKLYDSIASKVKNIDKSLEAFVIGEYNQTIKQFGSIEKKVVKAEALKSESSLNQLTGLKHKLFPDGKLQERYDSVLDFYINDKSILKSWLAHFDPFKFEFIVLYEDEIKK